VSADVLTIRGGFVAEVTGCEGLEGLDAGLLRDVATEHGVVVIRDLQLGPCELVELTAMLGPVELVWDVLNRDPSTDYVQVLSNQGRTPAVGADQWHTDRSFMAEPTRRTVLHPSVLPAAGGDTLFTDTKAAYRGLAADLKRTLVGCVGVHSYDTIGSLRAKAHGDQLERAYAEGFHEVRHPLVRAHPESGEPALYINALALTSIESTEGAVVDVDLASLYEHATHPRFGYRHQWRHGDVVIWDNACVMHRATALAADQHRVLYRTTTSGTPPRSPAEIG
jgi:taurine dioxygenase